MRTTFFKAFTVSLLALVWSAFSAHAQFTFTHIGSGATGSIIQNGPGSYTFEGGGNDIWSAGDDFDFAHVSITGDFDVWARVESVEPVARWTKAGLMARQELTRDSRMAFPRVTPLPVPTTNGGDGANDNRYAYRTHRPGEAGLGGEHEDGGGTYAEFPWLRLTRTGAVLEAFRSADGMTWISQGAQNTETWGGGALQDTVHVGLAVGRHSSTTGEELATVEFRDVSQTQISRPPQDVTVREGESTTFSVGLAGFASWTVQWQENGVDIPGATSRSYTTPPATGADNGDQYTVRATDSISGESLDSSPGTLTVNPSPRVVGASTRGTVDQIFVDFNEPVDPATGTSPINYEVTDDDFNFISITSIALDPADASVVVLTTQDPLPPNTYFVSVFNVQDRDMPPNTIDPNPGSATFTHPAAGFFFADFDDGQVPPGTATYRSANPESATAAMVTPTGGVGDSGVMRLTDNANSQQGFWLINDINEGKPVTELKVTFDARLGGSACCGDAINPRPADGFAFSFASNLPDGVPGPALACCAVEDGSGNGLAVSFDVWDNAGEDTAPSVDVIWRNQIVATRSFAGVREGGRAPATDIPTDPATGLPLHFITDHPGGVNFPTEPTFAPVEIVLDPDGTIDVSYKGVKMIDNVQTGYVPIVGGRFGFGGRTGGANETHYIDNLTIQTFNTLGPVQIVEQPQDTTVDEGNPVTFSVRATGAPAICYQWRENGVDIPGATHPDLTIDPTRVSMNGNVYDAVVMNEFSQETSAPATLTVITDTEPPTLVAVVQDVTLDQARILQTLREVTVKFSEPVDPGTAGDPFSYTLEDSEGNPVTVMSATVTGEDTVLLITARQAEGTMYILTVNDVTDQSDAGNEIAPDSQISYISADFVIGLIPRKYYGVVPRMTEAVGQPNGSIGGTTPNDLYNHPSFPENPQFVCYNNIFQLNTFDQAENYGAQINGYFIAKETGPHTFYISADDGAELFLSTNEDPANKTRIAFEPVWNGRRQWLVTDRRNAANPENRSAPIELMAGQRYYIEANVKEGGGGDNLAVAVQAPGDPPPPNDSTPIIGVCLGTLSLPDPNVTITITQQPEDQTVTEFLTATFTVSATASGAPCGAGAPTVQWRRNGQDIPGAIGNSFTTPTLTSADDGARYSARLITIGRSAFTRDATLTVVEDIEPPTAVSAASISGGYVGVCFSELLGAGADDPFNYMVTDGGGMATVTTASVRPDGRSVRLGLNRQVTGNFTVKINNVQDLKGLSIAPDSTVDGEVWASARDVIGPAANNGTTAPGGSTNFTCNTGDVDVVAGGADIWGTSDEFHFVHQQRTGDFDVKVKVQRLDAVNNWAKAGLMARETLDGNSATIEAYTTPDQPPGTDTYEAGRRPTAGVDTVDWGSRPNSPLPNAWIRLQRRGDTWRAFISNDGFDWNVFAGPATQVMAPTLFVGMATTSHNTGQNTVAEFRNFMDTSFPGAELEITQHPQDVTVPQNNPATFTVEAELTGAPAKELEYQWQRSDDGGATWVNVPGANGPSYTKNNPTIADDNGDLYRVIVAIPGISRTSDSALLTVIVDTFPPELVSASGSGDFTHVTVRFNEPVNPGLASDPFSYEIPGLDVFDGAPGSDAQTFILETSPQDPGTIYEVIATGIADTAGNVQPETRTTFSSFVLSCGFVRFDFFTGFGGTLVADLTSNTKYINNTPDISFLTNVMNWPQSNPDMNDYGLRMSGVFVPRTTGNHKFYVVNDDQAAVRLNPNGIAPQDAQTIITSECCRNYPFEDARSSADIFLMAGEQYYIEALVKEGGGGDYLGVGVREPGDARPTDQLGPISGALLGIFADPQGAEIQITQQPMDVAVSSPGGATFSVQTDSETANDDNPPHFYQWQRSNDGGATWMNIAGAHGASYTLQNVSAADDGALFRVEICIPGASVTSEAAVLDVLVNNPPSFTKGADQTAPEDAGPQTVPNWATDISPGPEAWEQEQTVSFDVSNDNEMLFSEQPAISEDGTLTYTTAPNAHGTANVTVVAKDDGGTAFGGDDTSDEQSFVITVSPVNDCPVALSRTAFTAEDTAANIILSGSDVDGDPLAYMTSAPANGTLSGTPPNVTYTPNADFCGEDRFTYTVSDGACVSEPAVVTVNVSCVNDCPTAEARVVPPFFSHTNDTFTVLSFNSQDALVMFDGSLSSDPDGDQLSYMWFQDPETTPFGTGVVAARTLGLGSHSIALVVSDGECTDRDTIVVIVVEVITGCEAVEQCIMLVENTDLDRKNKRPLIATLKAACASFERGNNHTAVNQLQAFQNKIRAQLKNHPAARQAFHDCVQRIIDVEAAR